MHYKDRKDWDYKMPRLTPEQIKEYNEANSFMQELKILVDKYVERTIDKIHMWEKINNI